MLTFHPLTLGVWKTKLTTFSLNSQPLAPSLPHVFPLVKQVLAYVYEFSGVLPVCVYCACTPFVYPKRPEKGIGLPGTEVTDAQELPCGC